MTEWLCPDIDNYFLLNHAETYVNGKDFRLVVDFCDPKSPSCTGLADQDGKARFLQQIAVNSKVVTQYFDTSTYFMTRGLQYGSYSHMSSSLIDQTCVEKEFIVSQNELSIYSQKLFDTSSFKFSAHSFFSYSIWFWNTKLVQYVHIPDNLKESTGLYALIFMQERKLTKTMLAIDSYDQVLASLGGYFGLVYGLFSIFTVTQKRFTLDNLIIKQIYHQDGRDGRQGKEPFFEDKTGLIRHRFENKQDVETMTFSAWITYNVIICCCKCFKRQAWYRKMKVKLDIMAEMRNRLNLELDIIQLIKSARYSRVVTKLKIKKLQRTLIGSFKNYIMNANKPFRADRLLEKA